eukprot:14364612-Alexandrium_andersonii.AAC.1
MALPGGCHHPGPPALTGRPDPCKECFWCAPESFFEGVRGAVVRGGGSRPGRALAPESASWARNHAPKGPGVQR